MARIKRRLCYYRYKPNKKTYKNKPNNNVKAKISASQTNKRFKKIIFTKYSAINITHRTSFAQLTLDAQKKELLASRQDTYLLKKKLEAKNAEPKIFRPWLIKKIWKKMSWRRKQNHLNRKRELFAKGVKFRKLSKKTYLKGPQNKVYFINAEHRPIIKIMGDLTRAVYLKKIINTAVPGYKNRIKGVNPFFSNPLQCASLLCKKRNNRSSRPHINLKKMPGQNNKLLKNLVLKKRARH